jgi:hypothetical protein
MKRKRSAVQSEIAARSPADRSYENEVRLPVTATSCVAMSVVPCRSSKVRVAGGADGEAEAEGLLLAEAEADGLALAEADALGEAEADAEALCVGLGLLTASRNATWMTWYSSAVAIVASSASEAAVVC